VILHRKELVNQRPPFSALRDADLRRRFDAELLGALASLSYTVVTVVMDKLAHMEQYRVWQHDPYHYCMLVLLERYVMMLNGTDVRGDVMAESRGGKEDRRLKDSFARLVEEGSDYVSSEAMLTALTSRQLKVKPKSNNIAGLQLADLVAHPSFRAVLARRNHEELPATFGGEIAAILEQAKYHRSPNGRIDGWGRKCLP